MVDAVVNDIFGNMMSAAQLEDAATSALKRWFPTYLAEAERQFMFPKGTLTAPKNYLNRDNFISEKGEDIPKIVVISQGLATQPVVFQGRYMASWQLGIGIATAATPETRANRMVKAYGAAIRALMLENQTLGVGPDDPDDGSGILLYIAAIRWVGENYNDVLTDNQIALYKSASVHFVIDVDNVSQRGGGPEVPTLIAPTEHTVQTVETTIELVEEI